MAIAACVELLKSCSFFRLSFEEQGTPRAPKVALNLHGGDGKLQWSQDALSLTREPARIFGALAEAFEVVCEANSRYLTRLPSRYPPGADELRRLLADCHAICDATRALYMEGP